MATANPTALFTTLPRTEFIQKNLGLVHSCAGRFTGRGIEYEELYSAGCLGLVKACDGFDPDRGVLDGRMTPAAPAALTAFSFTAEESFTSRRRRVAQ